MEMDRSCSESAVNRRKYENRAPRVKRSLSTGPSQKRLSRPNLVARHLDLAACGSLARSSKSEPVVVCKKKTFLGMCLPAAFGLRKVEPEPRCLTLDGKRSFVIPGKLVDMRNGRCLYVKQEFSGEHETCTVTRIYDSNTFEDLMVPLEASDSEEELLDELTTPSRSRFVSPSIPSHHGAGRDMGDVVAMEKDEEEDFDSFSDETLQLAQPLEDCEENAAKASYGAGELRDWFTYNWNGLSKHTIIMRDPKTCASEQLSEDMELALDQLSALADGNEQILLSLVRLLRRSDATYTQLRAKAENSARDRLPNVTFNDLSPGFSYTLSCDESSNVLFEGCFSAPLTMGSRGLSDKIGTSSNTFTVLFTVNDAGAVGKRIQYKCQTCLEWNRIKGHHPTVDANLVQAYGNDLEEWISPSPFNAIPLCGRKMDLCLSPKDLAEEVHTEGREEDRSVVTTYRFTPKNFKNLEQSVEEDAEIAPLLVAEASQMLQSCYGLREGTVIESAADEERERESEGPRRWTQSFTTKDGCSLVSSYEVDFMEDDDGNVTVKVTSSIGSDVPLQFSSSGSDDHGSLSGAAGERAEQLMGEEGGSSCALPSFFGDQSQSTSWVDDDDWLHLSYRDIFSGDDFRKFGSSDDVKTFYDWEVSPQFLRDIHRSPATVNLGGRILDVQQYIIACVHEMSLTDAPAVLAKNFLRQLDVFLNHDRVMLTMMTRIMFSQDMRNVLMLPLQEKAMEHGLLLDPSFNDPEQKYQLTYEYPGRKGRLVMRIDLDAVSIKNETPEVGGTVASYLIDFTAKTLELDLKAKVFLRDM